MKAALARFAYSTLLRLATPFSPMLRSLFEMRYLWRRPHQLDGTRLQALLGSKEHPDFKKRLGRWARQLLRDKVEELIAAARKECAGTARADAASDAAVARIFTAKGRPADHPLIVHVAGAAGVAHFAGSVPAFADKLMRAFWPGPLTLILPRRASMGRAAAAGDCGIADRKQCIAAAIIVPVEPRRIVDYHRIGGIGRRDRR